MQSLQQPFFLCFFESVITFGFFLTGLQGALNKLLYFLYAPPSTKQLLIA